MTEVFLVKTDDRIKGMKVIFSHFQSLFEALKDKRVAIKPNFNTADPPPASTDIEIIRVLISHLKACGAKKITVVERAGPADTHETMETILFGPDGNLYVTSVNTDQVLRYNGTNGSFIDVFASGAGLDQPRGAVFGPDGHLYVSGRTNMLRFNGTTGAFIDEYVPAGVINGPAQSSFVPSQQVTIYDNTVTVTTISDVADGEPKPTSLRSQHICQLHEGSLRAIQDMTLAAGNGPPQYMR